MIAAPALRALREALGAECLLEAGEVVVDGEALAPMLAPQSPEALATALHTLDRLELACVIRGGGSRMGLGNPPRGASLVLSTAALAGVDAFDASEGVCHALAGTPLAEIEARVAPAGWQLPLDPPGAASTLGGTLAAAALGPRAQGFGRPRDCVLGLEVALADGARTRCGGRVVKNVTGYDLNKLYTGSLGTLGVIEAAWLRLRPKPASVSAWEASDLAPEAACAGALAAARRSATRAAALHAQASGAAAPRVRVLIELAGDEASVERDAQWCRSELGAQPAAASALAELRELQGATPQARGLRFRLALLPSRCPAALAALLAAGAEALCHPGLGLVYARFALPPDEDADALAAAWRCVDGVATQTQAAVVLEAAPAWAKRERDVFGELGGALPIARRLKQQFDPAGRLNPGRFAGRL